LKKFGKTTRIAFMTSFSKYDVVVVKFPFASSLKYKARPAIVISSQMYNEKGRDTLLILAVSSNICNKLDFEKEVTQWKSSGLLKPSVFKSAIATIEKESVIKKLGSLTQNDIASVNEMLAKIC